MLAKAANLLKQVTEKRSKKPEVQVTYGLKPETKARMSRLSAKVRNGRFNDTKGDIRVVIHR